MAVVVPETLSDRASRGEQRLFEALRSALPDSFYVYYEPDLKSSRPDFTIISRNFGLLIIEVKGWQPSQILNANNNSFTIKYRSSIEGFRIENETSPLEQSRGYFRDALDRFKEFSILTNPSGKYRGKLVFPVGYGVVMSNILFKRAQSDNIHAILAPPTVAYRDELINWESIDADRLVSRLKQMFAKTWKFRPLTDDQFSTIRGVLHPERSVKTQLASANSVPPDIELLPDSYVIKTLDLEQERLAMKIRCGHQLIHGVAGSGKTIILIARAKYLIDRYPQKKIIILCFSATLAAGIRSTLANDTFNPQYAQIQVLHFHDWAKQILGKLPNPHSVNGNYNHVLGELLIQAISQMSETAKWDSILIDEASTFEINWFQCCVNALIDPKHGDLLIVGDGLQKIYRRRHFTWKSLGIEVAGGGRSKILRQNYRNTAQILALAWSVVEPIVPQKSQSETAFAIVSPTDAVRSGPLPILHLSDRHPHQIARSQRKSRDLEIAGVLRRVQRFIEQGFRPEDIAIIYHRLQHRDRPFFKKLVDGLNQSNYGSYWVTESRESKKSYDLRFPGVRILTASSSLGLEFRAVIIIWLDQFSCTDSDFEVDSDERQLLYVAMTRATSCLYLFSAQSNQFIEQIAASQLVEIVRY
ncbi:MAG: NERD domain-containing protein [Prochloraceae cyanobacterium]|nr:NERD domain-containing protein [Prochloraceae cyanobacterium]